VRAPARGAPRIHRGEEQWLSEGRLDGGCRGREGEADAAAFVRLRPSELTGRPLGSAGFAAEIEKRLRRILAPGKRGRNPRNQSAAADQ
jgi:hypothetical protein